jgi:hypothetical protein
MTLVMDIYVLARMLYLVQTNNSKTISCYVGSYHAYSYNYFFKKYMKLEPIWLQDKSHQKDNKEKEEKRCLQIPNTL